MRALFKHLFLLILLALGCSGELEDYANDQKEEDEFSIRAGRRTYVRYCSACHGEDGDGYGYYFAESLEVQPSAFTSPEYLKSIKVVRVNKK